MRQSAFRRIPVVGVDDGSFQKGIDKTVKLVATLLIGARIERVKVASITVDGLDATEALIRMVKNWKFAVILLAGLSYAGFNVVSPKAIYQAFGKPVISVLRTKPDNKAVKFALEKHFTDWKIRWRCFEELNSFHEVKTLKGVKPVYFGVLGSTTDWACEVIRDLCLHSRLPEPMRIAKLIARGIS